MHLVLKILAFAFCFSCSLARNSHRSLLKREPNVINNQSTSYKDSDPVEMTKRGEPKFVFIHVILGNTFPYTIANWKSDIQRIQANGVDAVALNLGSDSWEITQIANAYSAAQSLGTGFKLFISFDFTALACDPSFVVNQVNTFKTHPNQFSVNGQPMISTYEGSCLGNTGWASVKAQTNGYLMPFISGLEGAFGQWPALNSWLCWGCAWPQTNTVISTADDLFYINQLGTRYATSVSVWMYAHFGYKNLYLPGDEWLVNSRWEELFSLRNKLTFVEMVTWNDYGESDYFGPIEGAQPAGTTWATGFPHIAWFEMSQYYITAFKTGRYPAITTDVIYFWARPHPAAAVASNDPLPKPTGFNLAQDFMWAAVFATAKARVTLQCGSSSSTFSVTPGVNKLKIPLAPGTMTVTMSRNGKTVIEGTSQNYTYVLNPVTYNYNAWVGSASASGNNNVPAPPRPTPTTHTTTPPPTTPSRSTPPPTTPPPTAGPPTTRPPTTHPPTTIARPTKTRHSTTPSPAKTSYTTGDVSWHYQGCFRDDASRVLNHGPFVRGSQSIENCLTTCHIKGSFLYAGVEFGDQCFCSKSIRPGAVKVADSACSEKCAGNAHEKCGAGWHINVYRAIPRTSRRTLMATATTTLSRRTISLTSSSELTSTPKVTMSTATRTIPPTSVSPTVLISLC